MRMNSNPNSAVEVKILCEVKMILLQVSNELFLYGSNTLIEACPITQKEFPT